MARYRQSYFEQSISDRLEQFEENRNPYSRKTFSVPLTKKEREDLVAENETPDADDFER